MRLASRLARIEQAARPADGRCPTCRSWRGIVHLTPTSCEPDAPYQRDPPDVPDQCPDCGWQPFIIRVVYLDRHGSTSER